MTRTYPHATSVALYRPVSLSCCTTVIGGYEPQVMNVVSDYTHMLTCPWCGTKHLVRGGGALRCESCGGPLE